MKHIVSAIIMLATVSAFVGCGQPEVYSVTQLEHAFFVNSTTIGALARIDSNQTWTMVPDLDTLPLAVASLLWEMVPRDNTVYNLLTGDYVKCSGGNIVIGNIVQGTSGVVVHRESIRLQ